MGTTAYPDIKVWTDAPRDLALHSGNNRDLENILTVHPSAGCQRVAHYPKGVQYEDLQKERYVKRNKRHTVFGGLGAANNVHTYHGTVHRGSNPERSILSKETATSLYDSHRPGTNRKEPTPKTFKSHPNLGFSFEHLLDEVYEPDFDGYIHRTGDGSLVPTSNNHWPPSTISGFSSTMQRPRDYPGMSHYGVGGPGLPRRNARQPGPRVSTEGQHLRTPHIHRDGRTYRGPGRVASSRPWSDYDIHVGGIVPDVTVGGPISADGYSAMPTESLHPSELNPLYYSETGLMRSGLGLTGQPKPSTSDMIHALLRTISSQSSKTLVDPFLLS